MLQKRWQPRRPPASSPPMPSPGTSDRRAASYLARLREWRRQDRTSLLLRSGSTRVSSVALPRRLPFLNGRCSDDKRAELIIAHGYKRDYLHDHLLAASRAFHRCLAGLDHEPRPTISGARKRKTSALLLTVRFVRGVWRRPAFIRPMAVEIVETAPCDDISRLRRYLRRMLRAPKASASGRRVGRDGLLRTDSFASAQAPCSATSLQPWLVRRMTY